MKSFATGIFMLLVICSATVWGQQVIGSFPAMDGGFEAQLVGITPSASTISATSLTWTNVGGTPGNSATINESGGRSGPKSATFAITASGAHRRFQSPTTPIGVIAASTQYTVQYYYRNGGSANVTMDVRGGVSQAGTGATVYGAYVVDVNVGNTWTKYVAQATTNTTTAAEGLGVISTLPAAAGSMDYDDFVIYAGVEDLVAPDAATAANIDATTSGTISLSWTAPAGGTDGGGYVVVRGLADPATAPLINGIYAVGNTIGSGTLAYIGTSTSFLDAGLMGSTQYFYRIYTVDKAFNYSTPLNVSATTQAASLATEPTLDASGVTFANVGVTGLDIQWSRGNGSRCLVIMKAGSPVSSSPVDGTTYTAQSAFGAGSQIGSGNFVLHDGTGTSVSVTGLSKYTEYFVSIFEYNATTGGTENYLVANPASGSQRTLRLTVTSAASGTWATGSTWDSGTVPGQLDNVVIATSHVVTVNASTMVNNITVASGGQLKADSDQPTSNIRYLRIYGSTVQIDGTFGNTADDNNALAMEMYAPFTIQGGGTARICRLRPGSSQKNVGVTFNMDARITYIGTSGTGGSAIYTSNSSNDSLTVTVNAGKTVTIIPLGNFGTSSSSSSDGSATSIFNVNGTLDLQGGNLILRTAAGKPVMLNVAGTLKVGKSVYPTGTTGVNSTIEVTGTMTVGTTGSGTADFTDPLSAVTGTGTFGVASGSRLNVGAPAGLDGTSGPIKTTTVDLSSSADYAYVGTAAQSTGSQLPDSVARLIVSNAAGVSLTKSVIVDSAVTLTNGTLTTGADTLVVGPLGTMSVGSGYVIGVLKYAAMTGTKIFNVGTANGYSPVTVTAKAGTGDFAVGAAEGAHPHAVTPAKALLRYWTLKTSGITQADLAFQYLESDVQGVESTYVAGRYAASTWTKFTGMVDTIAHILTLTDIGSFSDWAVGEVAAFGPVSGVEDEPPYTPTVFALRQNYPNPFNPSTTIEFSVAVEEHAALRLYNVLGQQVAMLYDGLAQPGRFFRQSFDASSMPSGVYYYTLETGSSRLVRRMLLMK